MHLSLYLLVIYNSFYRSFTNGFLNRRSWVQVPTGVPKQKGCKTIRNNGLQPFFVFYFLYILCDILHVLSLIIGNLVNIWSIFLAVYRNSLKPSVNAWLLALSVVNHLAGFYCSFNLLSGCFNAAGKSVCNLLRC